MDCYECCKDWEDRSEKDKCSCIPNCVGCEFVGECNCGKKVEIRDDEYAQEIISNCVKCSRNRKSYPQMENVCLHYKTKDNTTSLKGFPEHCKLERVY